MIHPSRSFFFHFLGCSFEAYSLALGEGGIQWASIKVDGKDNGTRGGGLGTYSAFSHCSQEFALFRSDGVHLSEEGNSICGWICSESFNPVLDFWGGRELNSRLATLYVAAIVWYWPKLSGGSPSPYGAVGTSTTITIEGSRVCWPNESSAARGL